MFVSHRLEEVFSISQRITVMRDGRVVGSRPLGEWITDEVIRKMVGPTFGGSLPERRGGTGYGGFTGSRFAPGRGVQRDQL